MGKLAGKFALVTGGNSGIGLAAAKLFAAEGATVAISGRNTETLNAATQSLGENAIGIRGDILDPKDRAQMFATIKERFGALDVLFANAGLSGFTPLGSTDEAAFDQIVRLNFNSVFYTAQGALPLLRDGASIILTGSLTSKIAPPAYSAYAGAKAAVRVMAQSLAAELSPRAIRVNTVTPGFTRTPLWERTRTPQQIAAVEARIPQIIPLARWASPEEVAKTALFLATDDSSYIQGAEIMVDGGLSATPAGTAAFRG